MKISKIDEHKNKTSFKWTIPLNSAEKRCGLETWRFQDRMNGLGQYDVYIKPLKTKTARERDFGCWGPLIYVPTLMMSCIAGLGGVNYLMTQYLPNMMGGFIQIGASILGGVVFASGLTNLLMFKKYNDFSVQAATNRGDKKDEEGNPTPSGIITKEYVVKNDGNRYNPPVDFVREIQQLKQEKFKDFIKHYDTNDLFEPKNYARVLRNRPEGFGSEFFDYKIDDKGNTLLTAFFDITPEGEIYSSIVEYLHRCLNLDFNQKDGSEVSCIEKTLMSENKQALNLILNAKYTCEFNKPFGWIFDNQNTSIDKEEIHDPSTIPYSPELDDIYLHIQDKEFKKMVDDNIKWDFSNWIAVIQSHDVSKAEKLKQRFNSPLLNKGGNKQQLYNDINNALKNCHDLNFITYMQTNFLPQLMEENS